MGKQENLTESFGDLYPELLSNWDYDANPRNPFSVPPHSKTRFSWKCDKGHSWEDTAYSQAVQKKGCPYCSGRKTLAGLNDLATTHPHLVSEWKDSRDIRTVSSGSQYYAEWKCTEGQSHTYPAVVERKAKGQGCSYCSGKRVLAGFNDIATTHPELSVEWADTERDATTVSAGSHYKPLWCCEKGHEYRASVYHRAINGRGCPYCAGKMTEVGISDLPTTHPHLVDEWDDQREMSSVSYGSDYTAQWKCSAGHSWKANVSNRTIHGHKCPYCTGRKSFGGFNDLATTHPHLIGEWDDDREITSVSSGSIYKAQWKCHKGHTWTAAICDRTRRGTPTGCPQCWANTFVSRAEQDIADYIASILPPGEAVQRNDRRTIAPYELDIYIPSKNIAVEFNGLYWHTEGFGKDKWAHYKKWDMCRQQGIQLIVIWEDDWESRRELVENMLSHKLGLSKLPRTYARKTEVESVEKGESRIFHNKNHIQGHKDGLHLGLTEGSTGELVALSTWRVQGQIAYLDRYSTSKIVVGGFSKLLRHAIEHLSMKGVRKILTFSDHSVSDGELYKRNGFIFDGELNPDYSYFCDKKRKHKFGFRKSQFKKDPDLIYQEGRTESELANLNGLLRIWDYGKTRWALDIP